MVSGPKPLNAGFTFVASPLIVDLFYRLVYLHGIYEMMKQLIVFSSARNLHRNVQEGQGNQMTVSHIAILSLYQLYYIVYNNGHSHLI